MKNGDKVIYVGKAKNLRRRVLSYFNREHTDEKTKELVKNIGDIDFIICNSEMDALVLENNLIKKYTPKYNIVLKDQKTYPYIKVSKETFPKISIVRTTKALDLKNGEYFGPYPNGAWNLKSSLIKIFQIRDCNRDMEKKYERPCLKYHMKLCLGPCVYKDILPLYAEQANEMLKVLKGQGKKIIEELEKKMAEAAKNMEFEKAIMFREQGKELQKTLDSQITEYGKDVDEDIFTIFVEDEKIFLCVLNIRSGKIIGKNSSVIDIKNSITENLFLDTVSGYYRNNSIPKYIVFPENYQDHQIELEEYFLACFDRKVKFFFPKIKGRKKELLGMAYENLLKDMDRYYNRQNVIEEGLKKLYAVLELKNFPMRIECFDISNIQGKDAVASMSVSIEGKAAKKEYRKYSIKSKDTPDDFQMMREVIERRYGKLQESEFPDMILIDGGLGQINAVGKVLKDIGKDGIADLVSIAKREEEIYKYGEKETYLFLKSDEALKILQRVRDEAHRFGVNYHRLLRSKRVISSELDEIAGIGEKRKEVLLKTFGSVKRIKAATLEELKEIVPEKIAIELKNKLK